MSRRRSVGLGLCLATILVPSAASAQEASCPGEVADQELTLEYPVEIPLEVLRARVDTTMTVLGYQRAAPPNKDWLFVSAPRYAWPEGTEHAPWRTQSTAPGVQIALQLKGSGKNETTVRVRGTALCALQSRSASRSDESVEHSATLFAAMQTIVALSVGPEKALHAFDE